MINKTNKIKKGIVLFFAITILFFALRTEISFAQFGGNFSGGLFCSSSGYLNFCNVVDFFLGLIGATIPILISISVIVFVWGVFRYVMAEGEDKQKSRDVMLYGIIGLFVMVSVWGLVTLVKNTFDLDDDSNNLYFNNYNFWKGGGSGRGSGDGGGSGGGSGGGDGNTDIGEKNLLGLPNVELSPTDLSLPPIGGIEDW